MASVTFSLDLVSLANLDEVVASIQEHSTKYNNKQVAEGGMAGGQDDPWQTLVAPVRYQDQVRWGKGVLGQVLGQRQHG